MSNIMLYIQTTCKNSLTQLQKLWAVFKNKPTVDSEQMGKYGGNRLRVLWDQKHETNKQ